MLEGLTPEQQARAEAIKARMDGQADELIKTSDAVAEVKGLVLTQMGAMADMAEMIMAMQTGGTNP
ncbi:hypothetical protein ACH6CV_14400 [Bacillota bacterium Meth-B3]